jgi:hypothetical protein
MRVFKHKLDGKYYRLVTQRKSNVNTYIEVDEENNIILRTGFWTDKEYEQDAIIVGFDNLKENHFIGMMNYLSK